MQGAGRADRPCASGIAPCPPIGALASALLFNESLLQRGVRRCPQSRVVEGRDIAGRMAGLAVAVDLERASRMQELSERLVIEAAVLVDQVVDGMKVTLLPQQE